MIPDLKQMDKRKVLFFFMMQFFILFQTSPIALLGHLVPFLWLRHNTHYPWHTLLRTALPLWLIVLAYTLTGAIQSHTPFFRLDYFLAHLNHQAPFIVAIPYSALLTHLISGRDIRLILNWLLKPIIGEKKAANIGLTLALTYHFMPSIEQLWAKNSLGLSARGLVKPKLKKWLLCCKLTITTLFLSVELKHDAILARGYQEKIGETHWQSIPYENLILTSLLSYSYVVHLLFRVKS
jgi:energy-coupling factor transporter transmembrane protein EcfT